MKIIIPFRSREAMLPAWKDIPNVLIVEQAEGKEFNRGRLLNIGCMECEDEYIVFNDIDMVPMRAYTPMKGVTQLAKSSIQLHDYLGGVTMFDRKTFCKVGGFHNDFGERAQDNELMFNLKRLGIPVRYRVRSFYLQPHPRPAIEFDPVLWQRAQQPRIVQDQLSNCQYTVLERKEGWIKVDV